MTETSSGPGPGWYPTPDGSMRYWDGSRWAPEEARAQGHVVPFGQYPGAAAPPHLPPALIVAPKNPGLSLLASFFIPGLGQFVNGDAGKGAIFLVAYIVGWLSLIILIGFVVIPAVWIWSMIDAYQGAQRWNAQRGILS